MFYLSFFFIFLGTLTTSIPDYVLMFINALESFINVVESTKKMEITKNKKY